MTTTPMDPKSYNDIIKSVQLNGFRLGDMSAALKIEQLNERLSVKFDMDSTFERVGESDDYVVTSECALVFSLESNRKIALEIAATYRTDFLSAVPFTDDFFDIFKESSLRVIVWPYFRELVQNMMSRMDLPPFVLPITINPVLQGTSQPAHPTSKRKTKAAREGT